MKKSTFYLTAMSGLLLASCAQDEVMTSLEKSVNKQISYTVIADNGSRSATAYSNGTDVDEIHVAAWAVTPDENGEYALPGYGDPNTGNAAFINHDVVKRSGTGTSGTSGTFNYSTDARFWPTNGQKLDFYAVVDAPSEDNCFSWEGTGGHPGLPQKVMQLGKSEMKDMLFAYTPNQTLNKDGHQAQQNVSFSLNHAFAKVVITAQVKNKNLRVVITDAQINGIVKGGNFCFPYKSGEGKHVMENPAHWTVTKGKDDFMNLTGIMDSKDPVIVDYNESLDAENPGKENVAGVSTYDGSHKIVTNNDILVIPTEYSGRNGNGSFQTYIELEVYAFNITGDTFDEDTDMLVCGTREKDDNGNTIFRTSKVIVPIEFNWLMGTVNTYNIIFDCGTGGTTGEDPKDPSLVRIGYEVEVKPWTNVDVIDKEYDFSIGKTTDAGKK